MVRFGRIVFNEEKVVSVLRDGKAKVTTVTLEGNKVHKFTKNYQEVWEHFSETADNN